MIAREAIQSDIAGILQLQSVNLYTNLSVADRLAGFVMTPFTEASINELIAQTGAFIVEKEGVILGYVLAGSWDFFAQWPIFPYMVSRFPLLKFPGTKITINNSFQYGPVCIDRTVRGSQALPLLFATMRSSLASRYPIGVTFINQQNPRSLAAHTRKLNLEIIDDFEFNGSLFHSLAFSTTLDQ
jgi:hypothetical protein